MLAPPILEKFIQIPSEPKVLGSLGTVLRYLLVTVGEDARYRKNRGIMLVMMEARRAI